MMKNARLGLIDRLPVRPVETKGHIHILEIGNERFREPTNRFEGLAPVKGARCRGSEDPTGPEEFGRQALTMAALSRHATAIIAIAGAVQAQRVRIGWGACRMIKHQGGDSGHALV